MNKYLKIGILIFLIFGCNQKNEYRQTVGYVKLKDNRIRDEIEKMMKKDGPHTFVIFEEPLSGKFVQFAGNKQEELLFDLPSDQMDKEELERAKKILSEYGIIHQTSPTYSDETEMEIVGTLNVFSKRINNDIDFAEELASRVMTEIFGFSKNIELKIETD